MVVSAQLLINVILKTLFAVLGCAFMVTKVTPSIRTLLPSNARNQKSIETIVYFINIFIIVFTASLIIGFFAVLGNVGSFFLTIKPAFNIILTFFEYIQWILVAVVFVIAFNSLNK